MKTTYSKCSKTAVMVLALIALSASPSHAYQDLKKLATDLAARIHATKHDHVTVVDFVDIDKKPNRLGKFLALQLQSTLAEPEHKLEVVDQGQLPELFDQMELLSEGILDPVTGKQLGKVAGTEVLIVGTVMSSSMTVRLDVKAIDLQTAKVITGGSASMARIGTIERLASESEKSEPKMARDDDESEEEAAPTKKAAKAVRPPARSRHDQGVAFDVDGCSLSGDALTCAVTVTSERDLQLAVSFASRAWNEAGEEYGPGEIAIANSRSQEHCGKKHVLKGVPTRLALTFPQFEGDDSVVERLRLFWAESGDCWVQWRPVNFDKIALSDSDFSSPRSASHSGKKGGGSTGSGKERSGSIFKRLGGQVLDALEDTATRIIEKKTDELAGDDEEEEDPRPQ